MRSINDPEQTGKPELWRRPSAERHCTSHGSLVHDWGTIQLRPLLHHARGSYKVAT